MMLLALGVVVHDITDHALLVSRTGRREDAKLVSNDEASFTPHQSRERTVADKPVHIVTRSQGTLHIEENTAARVGLLGNDAWTWAEIPSLRAA